MLDGVAEIHVVTDGDHDAAAIESASSLGGQLMPPVMGVAAFLSMWISNVAAPVLVYSLLAPVLRTLPPRG